MPVLLLSLLLPILVTYSFDPCPDGYLQAPNGGDCFKALIYQNFFDHDHYYPYNFNTANSKCAFEGGLLASVLSEKENEFIPTIPCHLQGGVPGYQMGLRCIGKDCKWDDGSPYDYNNFDQNLPDDKQERCLVINYNGEWSMNHCDNQEKVCWVCRLKKKMITCGEGETVYGYGVGCISVHTEPLDMKSAEATCREEGGHLISIHGNNDFIKNTSIIAGLNATFYIGGEFVGGDFEWTDGTVFNYNMFPAPFPDTIFGLCTQMMLYDEFDTAGHWTNIPCSTKLPFMCLRYRDGPEPTENPVAPVSDERCLAPKYYTGSGIILSPNFPFSITSDQTCDYVMAVAEGGKVSLTFKSFDCTSENTLSFFDGLNSLEPFLKLKNTPPILNVPYTSTTNVMRMIFQSDAAPVGIGFEAEFNDERKKSK